MVKHDVLTFLHFIPTQIFLEYRMNMIVLTILFLKLINEFLVFSNCVGAKKTLGPCHVLTGIDCTLDKIVEQFSIH